MLVDPTIDSTPGAAGADGGARREQASGQGILAFSADPGAQRTPLGGVLGLERAATIPDVLSVRDAEARRRGALLSEYAGLQQLGPGRDRSAEARAIQLHAMLERTDPGTAPSVRVQAPAVALFRARGRQAMAQANARAEAPEWIELIPEPLEDAEDDDHVEVRDWRPGFKIPDPQALVDAFNSVPAHRRAQILDWEHATFSWFSTSNPAAGWIEELQVRGRAIYGRTTWTEDGNGDVVGLRYRYVSPVVRLRWLTDDEGNVDWHSIPEAVEFINAGLTNNPATYIRDLAMTPEGAEAEDSSKNAARRSTTTRALANARPAPERKQPKTEDNTMALSVETLALLGLAAGATDLEIEAAIGAKVSNAEPTAETPPPPPTATHAAASAAPEVDLAAFGAQLTQSFAAALQAETGPLKDELARLREADASTTEQLAKTRVDGVIAKHRAAGTIAPGEVESLTSVGAKIGPDDLDAMLSARTGTYSHLREQVGAGQRSAAHDANQPTDTELELAEKLGIEVSEIVESRNVLDTKRGQFSREFVSIPFPDDDDDDDEAAA